MLSLLAHFPANTPINFTCGNSGPKPWLLAGRSSWYRGQYGTLTQNEMTVQRIWLPSGEVEVTGVGYDPAGHFEKNGRQIDYRQELSRLYPAADDQQGRWMAVEEVVNAVGAYRKHGRSMIIIDFGTATTFDAISAKGEYLGGAISPGIMVAAEALFMKASKLPRVEIFKAPAGVVGKSTNEALKSGIIYGYAALVDGMVGRMKAEMGGDPMVIATGGLGYPMLGAEGDGFKVAMPPPWSSARLL